MTKRLKYTKDILTHMLNMNQQKNAAAAQNSNNNNNNANNGTSTNPSSVK